MELQQIDLLLRLILAHILADFVFQTNRIAQEKKRGWRSPYFYGHLLIVGVITYLVVGQWHHWQAPVFVVLAHGIIDALKVASKRDDTIAFVVDQSAHILSLMIYWAVVSDQGIDFFHASLQLATTPQSLLIWIAYLVVSLPSGYLIGYLTRSWQQEITADDGGTMQSESLTHAGKWIGILERVLILTFILVGELRPVGFLLAAKSIFRFGELKESKDRKRTEYILIGTLISFAVSVLIGIATKAALTIM